MEFKLLFQFIEIIVKNIACCVKDLAIDKEAKSSGLLLAPIASSKFLSKDSNLFINRISLTLKPVFKILYVLLKINFYKHTSPIFP